MRPGEQWIIQKNNHAIKVIEIHLTSTHKNLIRKHSDVVILFSREPKNILPKKGQLKKPSNR